LIKEIEQDRLKIIDTEKKLRFEVSNYGKELKKFESVVDRCPYCKQKVSEEHLKSEISDLQDKIEAVMAQLATNSQKLWAEDAKMVAAKEDLDAVAQAKTDLDTENASFVEEKQQLKIELSKILGSVAQINKELENLKQLKNPYIAEHKKQQEAIKILDDKVELDKKELEKLDKNVFATAYWVKAFKDVRLSLISEVLTQLELEVNNKLFQLGLQDWKVDFAVEGVTKGGKVKKGFAVTISTPQNLEPVPWNAWSGGETQRLRLAGALGMADLIVSKSGVYPELEVLDEPSQYLSTAGIESLLDILKDRAKTTGKRIFLVDHRHLGAEVFDGVYTIVKTPDGVVLE
jgi:exonuclease SbcC